MSGGKNNIRIGCMHLMLRIVIFTWLSACDNANNNRGLNLQNATPVLFRPSGGYAYRYVGKCYTNAIDSTYADTEFASSSVFNQIEFRHRTLVFNKLLNEYSKGIQTFQYFPMSSSQIYYDIEKDKRHFSSYEARFVGIDSLYVKFVWIWYSDTNIDYYLFRGKLLDSININSDTYSFPKL